MAAPAVPMALVCALLAISLAAQEPTLRGRVLDDDGEPIAGVAVCPFLANEHFVTAELAARPTTTTDADGVFVLPAPAPGERSWDRVLLVAADRLHLEATREEIARFPILLPHGRVLAGRVYRADGTAVAGVRVEATDLTQEVDYVFGVSRRRLTPLARTAVRTDARGAFVLAGACESAARVSIADVGWRSASVAPVSAIEPIELVLPSDRGDHRGGHRPVRRCTFDPRHGRRCQDPRPDRGRSRLGGAALRSAAAADAGGSACGPRA